jgi:preprotein translocase subunit SecG
MGTPTLLGKVTTAVAIVFTLTSFSLALLGGERAGSVVREPTTAAPAPPAPASPAPATPTTPAPAPSR